MPSLGRGGVGWGLEAGGLDISVLRKWIPPEEQGEGWAGGPGP